MDETAPSHESGQVGLVGSFFLCANKASVKPMLAVHFTILLYATAYWLQQPVLPYVSQALGLGTGATGFLQTVFAGVQLLGGPLVGRFADVRGERVAIITAMLSSALSYILLGCATSSVIVLFLSKLPSTLMHAMMVAQAYIARLSRPADRVTALGRLSLTYGAGMVLGSSLGGKLAQYMGLSAVAFLAAGLALCSVPLTVYCLPARAADLARMSGIDLQPAQPAAPATPADEDKTIFKLDSFARLLGFGAYSPPDAVARRLRSIFLFSGAIGVALSMQHATFSHVAVTRFGVSSAELGYLMAFSAALGVFFNIFVVGPASRRAGERALCTAAAALTSFAFLLYSASTQLAHMLGVLVVMALGTSTLYSVVTGVISQVVPPAQLGSAIGLRHGLSSALSVAAPTVAGAMLTWFGFGVFALVCSSCCLAASAIALRADWSDVKAKPE